MIRYIFILYIATILLTGCTNSLISKQLASVTQNEKAVVFTSCHVKPGFIPCNTTWYNHQTKNEVLIASKRQAQVLEPGDYSLIGFVSDKYASSYVYSINNLHNVASFSVKKGEVIYIGSLEFDMRKNSSIHNAINLYDDKNSSIQYLSEYQPELLSRLQTKLMQLSQEAFVKKAKAREEST